MASFRIVCRTTISRMLPVEVYFITFSYILERPQQLSGFDLTWNDNLFVQYRQTPHDNYKTGRQQCILRSERRIASRTTRRSTELDDCVLHSQPQQQQLPPVSLCDCESKHSIYCTLPTVSFTQPVDLGDVTFTRQSRVHWSIVRASHGGGTISLD